MQHWTLTLDSSLIHFHGCLRLHALFFPNGVFGFCCCMWKHALIFLNLCFFSGGGSPIWLWKQTDPCEAPAVACLWRKALGEAYINSVGVESECSSNFGGPTIIPIPGDDRALCPVLTVVRPYGKIYSRKGINWGWCSIHIWHRGARMAGARSPSSKGAQCANWHSVWSALMDEVLPQRVLFVWPCC